MLMAVSQEVLGRQNPFNIIRDLGRASVDAIEPLLIFHEFGRDGISPPELRSVLLDWHLPIVSGRSAFLDMIHIALPYDRYRQEVSDGEQSTLDELRHNNDPESGGYRDFRGSQKYPRKYRASAPTMYATQHAINLVRHLVGVEEGQQLSYVQVAEVIGEESVDKILQFVRRSKDSSGGFHHNPKMNETQQGRPSLWNTLHAVGVLWNLDALDGLTDEVKAYVWKCFSEDQRESSMGFRESVDKYASPEPTVNATASALRVLAMVGEGNWIRAHRDEFLTFLRSRIDVWGGLFEPGQKLPKKPTLLYTNAIISSLDLLEACVPDLLSEAVHRQRVIDLYRHHCKSRYPDKLLFGFAPGWVPNSHIMRETMVTLHALSAKDPEFEALHAGIFGDTQKTLDGIAEFIVPWKELERIG